jgi:catechol 2,3-dioxygenase-like lactoylglutathione lyase family enzyme
MPATKVFHVGILAADIAAARTRYAEVLDVTFGETLDYQMQYAYADRTEPTLVRACFTVGGPPFLEIIESQDNDGPFSRSYGDGLHHLAVWERDVDARLEQLNELGIAPEVTVAWADRPGTVAAYLPAATIPGTLLEIVCHSSEIPGYTPELPGSRD